MPDPYMSLDPGLEILEDLGALEQAIVEICDIETVHAIHERVRMIQKK